MKLLLDTHILLWAIYEPDRLSPHARALITDIDNELFFSVVSIWEIGIKRSVRRDDFEADPRVLRRTLLDDGYEEVPVVGEHALAIDSLPPIHGDPFDRLLIAQAMVEGITLLTADRIVGDYPGPIRRV